MSSALLQRDGCLWMGWPRDVKPQRVPVWNEEWLRLIWGCKLRYEIPRFAAPIHIFTLVVRRILCVSPFAPLGVDH